MTAPLRLDRTRTLTAPPANATEQLSRSGTPRWWLGETRPDDYVTELATPERRMAIFEEMRASDGAVNTAITAREQLIYSANWMLATADETPSGKEILAFVEDNIYPLLEDVLRQLAQAIHYGVGLFEPVYAWADQPFATTIARGPLRRAATPGQGRRIYLRKIARIRQRTIRSFQLAPDGTLLTLRQWVPVQGLALALNDVPAEKLILWTYNQQGDDYWGVPPTRHAYKAWTIKRQIENLNLLGVDRFGVGTPVAVAAEGWTDADYEKAYQYLASWRAGERAGLVLPPGSTVSVESGQGQLYAALQAWVQWYTLEIAKTWLTQGTELGSTQTGARALGEAMQDQAEGVIQADCEAMGQIINEKLIVPLVQWNFGPQESYPYFAPSQRVRASSTIGELIASWVQQGLLAWRAEDEQWLRDATGMPEIDIEARQAEMDQEQAAKDAAAKAMQDRLAQGAADPNAAPGDPAADPTAPPPSRQAAASTGLSRGRGSDRGTGGGVDGTRRAPRALAMPAAGAAPAPLYRTPEYSTWELAVVKPDMLARDLDVETARTTGEVQDILRKIDVALALLAMSFAAKGVASLADNLASLAVSATLTKQLRAAMLDAAQRARDYGARAVRSEVARQEQPTGIGPGPLPTIPAAATEPAPAPDPEAVAEQRDRVLQAEVDRAVADEIARRESAARAAARDAIAQAGAQAPAVLADTAHATTTAALEDLSTARTQQNVGGVVNAGFGAGRQDGADAIMAADPGRIRAKVYSAVMDGGTCEECAKWDGAEFPPDYPEDATGVQAPNPRCFGGYNKCRCLWVFVSAAESTPSAPASRGPLS